MNFLKKLDWENDDGINLAMINDIIRNQYYEKILSRYVRDQECIDIGFGTGLLSIIALKHGATHVTAYESDDTRYQLGCQVIERLNLKKKITLVHDNYNRNTLSAPVIFTETMSASIWSEGLWNNIPWSSDQIFLPGEYFLEIWAIPIPDTVAQGLGHKVTNYRQFNPGIDVDPQFTSLINEFIGNTDAPLINTLVPGINKFNCHNETTWGWKVAHRLIQNGNIITKYSVNSYQEGINNFVLSIPTQSWKDQTVLIVPRAGAIQDTDVLYLDTAVWGPSGDPIILVKPSTDLIVTHDLHTGNITFLEKK
jgi:Ribosomal protein L11 methyltransferase (PrmA)